MGVGTALSRIWYSVVSKATEGQFRPGPWPLPISGGVLGADWGLNYNWWQLGYSPEGASRSAMVEACVSAYAQTVAMLPGDHWWALENGGRKRVTNSALHRILRKPNAYQTFSDFMLNATRSLYLEGNAYALGIRNERYEIDELHLMDPRQSSPTVSKDGDIFYRLGGNNVIDRQLRDYENEQLVVPARDVLHIRMHCYEHKRWPFPLVGESPLMAAVSDLATYEKIKSQQDQFFQNQARPSAVLTTDMPLSREDVQMLRDRWNEQAKGLHAGGVPILTNGLKVMQWADKAARDMQVAELLKYSNDNIALVFRIPLAILGLEKASVGSTETLMMNWIGSGLGFCLNHIEEAFDRLFRLKGQPDEYTEFDTEALLRSARKDRIEMLARAVQGGIMAPNEARAKEDLPEVAYGGEPRVQQQVVPLSAAGAIGVPARKPPSPIVPTIPPAPPAPAAAPAKLPSSLVREFVDDRSRLERILLAKSDRYYGDAA